MDWVSVRIIILFTRFFIISLDESRAGPSWQHYGYQHSRIAGASSEPTSQPRLLNDTIEKEPVEWFELALRFINSSSHVV